MTRIYSNPNHTPNTLRLRALLIGAGQYPNAKARSASTPQLADLSSVGPTVRTFASKLIRDWQDSLEVPLSSVDLLLSEPGPDASLWTSSGVPGEVADATLIDSPNLPTVRAALANALQGADTADHFLFMCCGHGFFKGKRYFILSDFGADQLDPWSSVIDLDCFAEGLSQQKPRNQWLFFDCCSDIPDVVLNTLGPIGQPLIQPNALELILALRNFGPLSRFGLASSTPGAQAFGIANRPSRFCEMLMEAIDGAGAVRKKNNLWCVDHMGIDMAVKSYASRKCTAANAAFYTYSVPIASDSQTRMFFRSLNVEPRSCFVAFSNPGAAIKDAKVIITQRASHAIIFQQNPPPPGQLERIYLELAPRQYYDLSVCFPGGNSLSFPIWGDLPEAEPGQIELK